MKWLRASVSWPEAALLCLVSSLVTCAVVRTVYLQRAKRHFVICTTLALEGRGEPAGVEFASCDDGRKVVLPAEQSEHVVGERWRSWWPDPRGDAGSEDLR